MNQIYIIIYILSNMLGFTFLLKLMLLLSHVQNMVSTDDCIKVWPVKCPLAHKKLGPHTKK